MSAFVFLTEELSMVETLKVLLPKLGFDVDGQCTLIPHNGISDLRKSLPRKLRAWQVPSAKFVIVLDQDSSDCMQRKAEFSNICADAGKSENSLVRIACRELESWFLGDFEAIKLSNLPKADAAFRERNKAKFREPDNLLKPSAELANILPGYQKTSGARAIARHLDPDSNNSTSFNVFVSAMKKLAIAS